MKAATQRGRTSCGRSAHRDRRSSRRRFETPPGRQAQVDFAEFTVAFTDEPGVVRKVWLFSMVLGHSRWALGPVRGQPEPPIGPAVPHRGVRGDGRGARGDPLRPDEDRRDRRGRSRRHHLQRFRWWPF